MVLLSWLAVIPPEAGWFGFGVLFTTVLLMGVFPFLWWIYPNSQEGFPVAPSNSWVAPETPLSPGSPVLAFSQGRWWRGRVVALETGDRVRVTSPGWGSEWDECFPRDEVQIDVSAAVGGRVDPRENLSQ